jgi:hypothetical protein
MNGEPGGAGARGRRAPAGGPPGTTARLSETTLCTAMR